jgi:hypothetical protein
VRISAPGYRGQGRTRALQRDGVELLARRIERGVDPRHFLFEQHVAALLVEPLIIGGLERLEGAHQLAMKLITCHERIAGNAGLGFEFGRSFDIHQMILIV